MVIFLRHHENLGFKNKCAKEQRLSNFNVLMQRVDIALFA
jgi:hypothetical protein